MIRCFLMFACLAVSAVSLGCCSPVGYGPGCGASMGCNDCDGLRGNNLVPRGPLDGLRQLKRSIVCGGGGCGETYIGEWISTPPDAVDPCCGDQWVGGAQKCRPFCLERGTLLRGLYGSRVCSGEESSAPCGCGEVCDGSCYGGHPISSDYIEHGVIGAGLAPTHANTGCSTCGTNGPLLGSRVSQAPNTDPMTRSASRMSSDMQRIRR